MSLKISRILHAGYLFEYQGKTIAFDPIFENPFSGNCHAFPNVNFQTKQIRDLRLDAVFISHYHDDHCSLTSLDLLDRATPIYLYCLFDELFDMLSELGFRYLHRLHLNATIAVGALRVIPRRALDDDVDCMFQIQAGALNVLNVVDSWIDPDTLAQLVQFAPWDMVLWPFQTMRELEVIAPSQARPPPSSLPSEWLEQLQQLLPRYVVPSSCQFVHEPWSWYNHALFPITYGQFQIEVEAAVPTTTVLRMDPASSVLLELNSLRAAPPLTWVEVLDDPHVDYQFDPDLAPPSTAAIAKHFGPLNAQQSAIVTEYCNSGLLKKYAALRPSNEGYFKNPKRWRLVLYDHHGAPTQFNFVIQGPKILASTDGNEPVDWTTELPVAKLYGALERGEALTTMYLRINDTRFSPEIERSLLPVDINQDPLLRCLFDGVFGAYQKNQLKELTSQWSR